MVDTHSAGFAQHYLNVSSYNCLQRRAVSQEHCSQTYNDSDSFSQWEEKGLGPLFLLSVKLLFYFCITDYHTLINLKQHTFLISWFPRFRSPGTVLLCPLFRVLQDSHQGVYQATFSSGVLAREESTSLLIQVVGRIYFLGAASLRAQLLPVADWLSKSVDNQSTDI